MGTKGGAALQRTNINAAKIMAVRVNTLFRDIIILLSLLAIFLISCRRIHDSTISCCLIAVLDPLNHFDVGGVDYDLAFAAFGDKCEDVASMDFTDNDNANTAALSHPGSTGKLPENAQTPTSQGTVCWAVLISDFIFPLGNSTWDCATTRPW